MKVLVTGGAGFIGSHLVQELQGKAEITVIDNFETGKKENLEGLSCTLIEGDINNIDLLREALAGVDYVFHMAAAISVVESMEKPIDYVKTNTIGTLRVLEEASRANVKKLLFCSSAAVYGENPESPKHENVPPKPLSPYAITKLDGEYYCGLFNREKRLKTVCARFFNVFGPRQDPKSPYAAAIPIFVSRAVKNEEIIIYGDGKQTRDFVFVKDVVKACIFLVMIEEINGIFNVAYGRRTTINDVVKTIIEKTKSESKIVYAPTRPGEIKDSLASIEKILSNGFTPSSDLESGLDATINYFRSKN